MGIALNNIGAGVTNIIDQITTTEDEAEEGTGVDLSGQEQEDLSDPTRFTGPIGAGIGPETTDEDFQNQLAEILEGQGTGVYTAGAQPSGDAFEIGEGIKPPVPVGLEEKIDSLKETFANLADQSTDLYNQAMGINIPGLTNMFDEPATMSDIFSGDIQGLDTDAIKNADVFLGLWDDNRYVEKVRDEFKKEQPKPKLPEAQFTAMCKFIEDGKANVVKKKLNNYTLTKKQKDWFDKALLIAEKL